MDEPRLELSEEEWEWVRNGDRWRWPDPVAKLIDFLLRVEAGRQKAEFLATHDGDGYPLNDNINDRGLRENWRQRTAADWLEAVRREKLGE